MVEPIEPKVARQMRRLADYLQNYLPRGYGFALFTFQQGTRDGRMNYISNAERTDMVAALYEFLANESKRGLKDPILNLIGAVAEQNQPWKDTVAELEAIRDQAEQYIDSLRIHNE